MGLTREQILKSRADRKPVRIEVPEWGGDVFARVLSVKDQMELGEGRDPKDFTLLLLIAALVNESGERIFTDADFDALAEFEFPVVLRVFTEVAQVNGITTKELEEAMELFKPAPDASRSTG